ncbi:MAG: hypothetical protein JRI95_13835 [Deltaproteobacteria bacterium]|nr:hypothetical protein [Deltaproteobacteria bacterium]
MVTREGSTQSRTFEAIKASGEITIKGLQEILGMPGSKGYARISHAARDLMLAGYIERTAPATYKYVREPKDLDYAKAQKRMVRVIRIRTRRQEPITARKLSELSDCSLDWSRRYVNYLVKNGYLERTGFERVGQSKVKASVYLGVESKLNDDWPSIKRQRKTAKLDRITAKIRERALTVARECQASRESLAVTADHLRDMISLIENALAATDNF